mmetsp:Transcript_8574/g.22974  ORF Transcript_8574/g.22974 Transcript_8574/m.22974 type:complete len:261 (-) Transcript_8574:4680-5462(-)
MARVCPTAISSVVRIHRSADSSVLSAPDARSAVRNAATAARSASVPPTAGVTGLVPCCAATARAPGKDDRRRSHSSNNARACSRWPAASLRSRTTAGSSDRGRLGTRSKAPTLRACSTTARWASAMPGGKRGAAGGGTPGGPPAAGGAAEAAGAAAAAAARAALEKRARASRLAAKSWNATTLSRRRQTLAMWLMRSATMKLRVRVSILARWLSSSVRASSRPRSSASTASLLYLRSSSMVSQDAVMFRTTPLLPRISTK